jgi:hypothetical protein
MTRPSVAGDVATPPCMNATSTPDLGSSSSLKFSCAPSVIRSSTLTPSRARIAL